MIYLHKYDTTEDGSLTITDEDRLCFLVDSRVNGARGVRTIRKALLEEFMAYMSKHPDKKATEIRVEISGLSDIDKFEYGYAATYYNLAKLNFKLAKSRSFSLPTVVNTDKIGPLQQIFYGAPGTGKSHKVDEKCKMYSNHRTTFHPDSDYSTFVGCYKPTKDKDDKSKITYAFTPQAFTNAYIEAWEKFEKNEPVLLVIEEINRGNCAQIFGDLFQLLDRNDDGYSTYPIEPDTDLGTYIGEKGLKVQNAILKKKDGTTIDISENINSGKKLVLPPNLYIWATMNTSDQSLFPIDSAFKRRWDWKYVPIRKKDENYKIETDKYLFDWWDFLEKANKAIGEATSSEDKKLGYFFCKGDEKGRISADKFVSKVLFYLWTDVFKDYDADEVKFRIGEKDYELLKYKANESDTSRTEKFAFSDFFDEEGNADQAMVEKFLMNIEVLKEENIKEGKEVEDGGSDEEGAATGTFQADSKIPQ